MTFATGKDEKYRAFFVMLVDLNPFDNNEIAFITSITEPRYLSELGKPIWAGSKLKEGVNLPVFRFGGLSVGQDVKLYFFGVPFLDRFEPDWVKEMCNKEATLLGFIILLGNSNKFRVLDTVKTFREHKQLRPYLLVADETESVLATELSQELGLLPDEPLFFSDTKNPQSVKKILLELLAVVQKEPLTEEETRSFNTLIQTLKD